MTQKPIHDLLDALVTTPTPEMAAVGITRHPMLLAIAEAESNHLPATGEFPNSVMAISLEEVLEWPFAESDLWSEEMKATVDRLSAFPVRPECAADTNRLRAGIANRIGINRRAQRIFPRSANRSARRINSPQTASEINRLRKRLRAARDEFMKALAECPPYDRFVLGLVHIESIFHGKNDSNTLTEIKLNTRSLSGRIELLEQLSSDIDRYCVEFRGRPGRLSGSGRFINEMEFLACCWFTLTGRTPDLKSNRGTFGHFLDEFLPDLGVKTSTQARKPALRSLIQCIRRHPGYLLPFHEAAKEA